jgi:hypothetical protein
MKKIIVVMLISIFTLIGCSSKTTDENRQSSSDAILEELLQQYENNDINYVTLEKAAKEMETLRDEEVKNELIELVNKQLEYISQEVTNYESLVILQDRFTPFLNEEVLNLLNNQVLATTPLDMKLEKSGYNVEHMDGFRVIEVGMSRPQAIQILTALDEYEFMCEQPCTYLITEDTVVKFEKLDLVDIFVIKDENGAIVNPFEVEVLKDEAIRDHEYQLEHEDEWLEELQG